MLYRVLVGYSIFISRGPEAARARGVQLHVLVTLHFARLGSEVVEQKKAAEKKAAARRRCRRCGTRKCPDCGSGIPNTRRYKRYDDGRDPYDYDGRYD